MALLFPFGNFIDSNLRSWMCKISWLLAIQFQLDTGHWEFLYSFSQASQVVLVVKNPCANAGDITDAGSIPDSGRSLGGSHGNPLLENPMERGTWQAAVNRVTKSQTRLRDLACTQFQSFLDLFSFYSKSTYIIFQRQKTPPLLHDACLCVAF